DVTIEGTEQIVAHVRFKGGATETLSLPFPPPFAHSRLTAPEILATMEELLHPSPDAETAEQLNARGSHPFDGLRFGAMHVSQLRRQHGLKSYYDHLREQGWLTADELAQQQGVSAQTLWRWYHRDRIKGARYNERGTCLFTVSFTEKACYS